MFKDVHHVQYSHLNIFYFAGESLCHERWYSWSCRSRHECCGCVVQCSSSSADCWLLRLRSSNISSIWVSYLVYFLAGWNSICIQRYLLQDLRTIQEKYVKKIICMWYIHDAEMKLLRVSKQLKNKLTRLCFTIFLSFCNVSANILECTILHNFTIRFL